MVLISSKKYACETCIKGHRSSSCKHTDRPLFEIKKKGRPVTQCEHCRELRKKKQVHIKCICMAKDDAPPPASAKKGLDKILECAAFPNGLPLALEASVALPDGAASDSDRSDNCACAVGKIPNDELCPCATPRKSAPRRRAKVEPDLHTSSVLTAPSPGNKHILARISEFRPVLPKVVTGGPVHLPSAGTSHTRPHPHDLYSPYGRAYDQAHAPYQPLDPSPFTESASWSAGPLCSCGDGCGCSGCGQHDASSTSCTNPSKCGGCVECYVQALPPLPASDPLDDWMRQQFAVDYSLVACTHGCPPGLCQCESQSGCGSSSTESSSCCKAPSFDIPQELLRSRSSSSSSSGSSPQYADLGAYAASNPDLELYGNIEVGSNPDSDGYARSNPDSDGYARSNLDLDEYARSNPDVDGYPRGSTEDLSSFMFY